MFGTCLDHVWGIFTSRPASPLKCSRLNNYGIRHMFMRWPIFGTMSGPYFDNVNTRFDLASPQDKENFCGVCTFWDMSR